jgi:DNA-directed RNA polymerase subunit RPC12/RpoP
MALYGCRKCGRSFEELQLWGLVKVCGDYWKCTSCDEDIKKDLDVWFKECTEDAKMLWGLPMTTTEDF